MLAAQLRLLTASQSTSPFPRSVSRLCIPAPSPKAAVMVSSATLSSDERRALAAWAAGCAERVLPLFEAEAADGRIRAAIEHTYAFSRNSRGAAGSEQVLGGALRAGAAAASPAGLAAARAAAQAAAVPRLTDHALGAAAYAAQAAGLALGLGSEAVDDEVRWQLEVLSPLARDALRRLPTAGIDELAPLGTELPVMSSHGQAGTGIRGQISTGIRGQIAEAIHAAVQ